MLENRKLEPNIILKYLNLLTINSKIFLFFFHSSKYFEVKILICSQNVKVRTV